MLGVRVALHPGGSGVVGDLLGQQPDQAADGTGGVRVAGVHRQVQREYAVAEGLLAGLHGALELGARGVNLGYDHGARHADRGALVPQDAGHAVDAVGGRHHEQGGVRGAQAGAQVPDEVGIAGGVEQVDLHPGVLERGDRQ